MTMAEIDFLQEALRRRLVFGDDAIGMMRAEGFDMRDRLIETIDDPHGE